MVGHLINMDSFSWGREQQIKRNDMPLYESILHLVIQI